MYIWETLYRSCRLILLQNGIQIWLPRLVYHLFEYFKNTEDDKKYKNNKDEIDKFISWQLLQLLI